MLTLGQALIGKKILSLRTGAPVGEIMAPIINPHNLKIEGWHALDMLNKRQAILLSLDIRDIIPQGFVVNDQEALTDPTELVRLKDVLETEFEIIGKSVVTNHKKKLGKVNDYSFEKNGFFVQKLYVQQSILKSFSGGALVIDRTQIIEINHKQIVVKEATVEQKDAVPMPATAM